MDRYLENDLQDFSDLMRSKGYKDLFLVNSYISGSLFDAMHATVMKARDEEYDPFPMILHTRLLDPRFEGIPLLMLRVDRTDCGLKIRDAEVESLMVRGQATRKAIPFSDNKQFPEEKKLLNSLAERQKIKQKRKGI